MSDVRTADLRVTAEAVRQAEAGAYMEIIGRLIHENALLSALASQQDDQLKEMACTVAALEATLTGAPGTTAP